MLLMLALAWLFWPARVDAFAPSVGFSQVKVRGSAAGDEFIELLNPSESAVDLNGYKIVKQTTSGASYTLITLGQERLAPRAYYLLALGDSIFASDADMTYSTALADNNRLLLLNPTGTLIDSLAWGAGTPLPNHTNEQSFQRPYDAALGWGAWMAGAFSLAHDSNDMWVAPTVEPEAEEFVVVEPSPSATTAAALSEIQLWPGGDDQVWVELFNTNEAAVDLTGYTITIDDDLLFALSGEIQANSYAVFFGASTLENRQRSVRLHNANGVIVDAVEVTVPTNDDDESFARDLQNVWYWTSMSTGGRPNILREPEAVPVCPAPTSPPVPVTTPVTATAGRVQLNELFANPSGDEAEEEFIELYNVESFAVSLSGWIIRDAAKSVTLGDIAISAQGYLVLRRDQTALSLNNSNETLTLVNAAGQAVDTFTYPSAAEDKSWNRNDAGWYEAVPTPGTVNIALPPAAVSPSEAVPTNEPSTIDESNVQPAPQPTVESPIVEDPVSAPIISAANSTAAVVKKAVTPIVIKETPFAKWDSVKPNTSMTIVGVLSVAPGTFNEKTAYMQDIAGVGPGIELYFTAADWPALVVGDIVQVSGKKSSAKSGRRLLLSSATNIVVFDHIDIEPAMLLWDELGAEVADRLVMLEASVTSVKSGLLQLADTAGLTANIAKAGVTVDADQLPATGLIIGLYKHGTKPTIWLRDDDGLVLEQRPTEVPSAVESAPIKETVLVASDAPIKSDWLTPFAAAGSAGGLGWYFFQDSLRKHAGRILEIIKR